MDTSDLSEGLKGRALFLARLRKIADVAVCSFTGGHLNWELPKLRHDRWGLELVRLYIRDIWADKYGFKGGLTRCGLTVLHCRHFSHPLTPSKSPCLSLGTPEQGKAMAFVMKDFLEGFEVWANGVNPLRNRSLGFQRPSTFVDFDDVEGDVPFAECMVLPADYEDDDVTMIAIPSLSQSSETSSHFASQTKGLDIEISTRTKQRVHLLTYLFNESDSFARFKTAWDNLIDEDSKLEIAHLCGCGLNADGANRTCVAPDHLTLISKEANLKHISFHEQLVRLESRGEYAKRDQLIALITNTPGDPFFSLF